ncbi:hypothetical protein C8R46DRAFT_1346373 [Mycena filopes]|nr:hypothetical protein C8R46DRAFT_1346373 [Mycena filopes]
MANYPLIFQLSDPAFHSSERAGHHLKIDWVGTVRVHEKTHILDNSYSSETHRSDIHLRHPPSPPRRQARLNPLPFDSRTLQQPEEVPTQSVEICVRRHRKSTWIYRRIPTRLLDEDAPRRRQWERGLATDTHQAGISRACLRGGFAVLLVLGVLQKRSSQQHGLVVGCSESPQLIVLGTLELFQCPSDLICHGVRSLLILGAPELFQYPFEPIGAQTSSSTAHSNSVMSSACSSSAHGLVVGCSLLVLVQCPVELFQCPAELIIGAHQLFDRSL